MADNNTFTVKVITPDRTFYEGTAEMLEFTTTEGEIGIYARHIPMTVVIAPGMVTITEQNSQTKIAGVYSGFAEILGDQVTLLAEIAEWPDEIDVERARAAEQRARERLETRTPDLDIVRAEIALKKSIVRQRIRENYK